MSNEVIIITPVMTGLRWFLESRGVIQLLWLIVSWNYVVNTYLT